METRPLKRDTSTVIPSKGKNPLLSDECVTSLNKRVQEEEYSSRIYLAMSMWLNNNGYAGSAKRWKTYSEEEMKHADWSREYLLAMGVQPITPKLEMPTQTFTGLPQIIEMSYQHEIDITTQCTELASMAMKKGDFMLFSLSQQYLKEQVEEHMKMQDLMDRLTAFGTDKIALRLLDNELGE